LNIFICISSASKNAKIKGAKIIQKTKTPKLRAAKNKGFTVIVVCLFAWCLTALSTHIGYIVPLAYEIYIV